MSHSPYTLPPAHERDKHIIGLGANLNDKLMVFQRLQGLPSDDIAGRLETVQKPHDVRIPRMGTYTMRWFDNPDEVGGAVDAMSAGGKSPSLLMLGPNVPSDIERQMRGYEIPTVKLHAPLLASDILETTRQHLRYNLPRALLIKGDPPETQPATLRMKESVERHGFIAGSFDHMRDWDASKPVNMRQRPSCIMLAYDSGKGPDRLVRLKEENQTLPTIMLYNDVAHDNKPLPKEMLDAAEKHQVPLVDPYYKGPAHLDPIVARHLRDAGILPNSGKGRA